MNRLLQTLVAAAALAIFMGWLVEESSPAERFRQGLRSLRANSAEGVYYSLFSLSGRPEYEEEAGLLQGWLQLRTIRAGDAAGFKDALTELELAADNEKNRALALALVGHAFYQQGRLRDAINMLAKSLEADPDEVEAHRWLGVAFYDIGNTAAALFHLDRVAKAEPKNGRPHRLMGLIYLERPDTDFDRAAAAYEESLARDPDQPDADEIRLELARCHFARLKYDEALSVLRPCAETAEVLTLQARCYHAKGLIDEAKRCMEQALAQAPDDVGVIEMQATLAEEQGDHRRAAELWARAVEAKPNEYNLRFRLAQAYRRIGQKELADQQAARFEELRQLQQDLITLVQQADHDAGNAEIRYGIAALADQLGMSEMAESWRQAAQMLDLGSGTAPSASPGPLSPKPAGRPATARED